ncbi:hypothetical protein NOF04DRAFT_1282848 [Fusarium oxysporum II5]|nr:hypothetical protein NOF04DRAFT_1282848 [Fusarium oxysporum II5]
MNDRKKYRGTGMEKACGVSSNEFQILPLWWNVRISTTNRKRSSVSSHRAELLLPTDFSCVQAKERGRKVAGPILFHVSCNVSQGAVGGRRHGRSMNRAIADVNNGL